MSAAAHPYLRRASARTETESAARARLGRAAARKREQSQHVFDPEDESGATSLDEIGFPFRASGVFS